MIKISSVNTDKAVSDTHPVYIPNLSDEQACLSVVYSIKEDMLRNFARLLEL